ncbi:unnamed protein product [Zymoseptoria tritici ST99CH_3D7]|uniref:Mitochondrial distribution and morphology protein 35 n=1 Tax=Zymoseptoria tritici (strain ST99CH_3D7) TaxID=1276538 RepID=A0A1X7S5W6_ZYMT9|nr:unnamed protein product [Zymoseptoria tritici ST99CH_3D7]
MSASLASECNEVKERYDSCFLKWYSEKYVRGVATTDECEPLFKQYQVCLKKALKDRVHETESEEWLALAPRPECILTALGESGQYPAQS